MVTKGYDKGFWYKEMVYHWIVKHKRPYDLKLDMKEWTTR